MGLMDEVRYGMRALRRDAGFSLATIFALSLSLGASTAVFTVVKSVLLEPLPMKDPEQLVDLWSMRPDGQQFPFNIPNYFDLRERNQVLEDVAAYGGWNANLTGEAEPERLLGVRATGNYFRLLGVQAALGRVLEPADDAPGAPKVVVLMDGIWQHRYGADPAILGKSIRLNGDSYTVVGVLPPNFPYYNPNMQLAVALSPDADPWRAVRKSVNFLRVAGRLKRGISPIQAKGNLDAVAAQLRREYPEANAAMMGIGVVPMSEGLTQGTRPTLRLLMWAVLVVLLIACINISGLSIARAAGRRKELAIQAALGGGRWRLARQRLVESVLLLLAAGVIGVLLARWGVALLLAISPAALPRTSEIRLDTFVVAASLGLSLFCGLLCGAIPALQTSHVKLSESLRGDARTNTADTKRKRLRGVLVIAEVSLSLVLLTGAGLLLRSFHQLLANDPGFHVENVETLRLALPATRYRNSQSISVFHDQVRQKILDLPGVTATGAISILPLSGPTGSIEFTIDGQPPVSASERPTTEYRVTDSTYFQAMGIPLLKGRNFSDHDDAASRTVVIVSEALAKLYWKDRNPVGMHVKLEDNGAILRDAEVIGVSGSVRELSLEQPATPCLFVPIPQMSQNVVRFVTNNFFWAISTRPGTKLAGDVRKQIHAVDGDVAASETLMEQYVAKAASVRLFSLRILTAFAVAAFLLAASGLYALVSYSTVQRTREIGVRMALGARSWQVAGLVVWQGWSLAVLGLLIGMAASWALSKYLAPLLFGVSPHDPVTLCGAGLLMLAAAAAASYLPARRAIRVDPAGALRSE
jgi:putative ABC transport system permease protein